MPQIPYIAAQNPHAMPDAHYFDQGLPDSSLLFRMVRVPAGEFFMGSTGDDPDASDDEKPRHRVRLDGYWMGETPVTQTLWEAVTGDNPSHFKDPQRPVEQVSWFDAAVFCNALSERTGRRPAYLRPDGQPFGRKGRDWVWPNEGEVRHDLSADGYRLPTEAEWEHAAREGAGADWRYCGADELEQTGWYSDNSGGETREVALLLPNALGLYDMSGNVYEWCEDWYGEYADQAQQNPRGHGKGLYRVIRGGFWGGDPRRCRPACRYGYGPDFRRRLVGFRLALSLQSVE